MTLVGLGVIFCLGAMILWFIYTYNVFREKQSMIDFWWDEVDTHLQLRRELIPSLIDKARPLMGAETSALNRIADIREAIVREAISTKSLVVEPDMEHLENKLSSEMRSLRNAFRKLKEIQMNSSLLTVMSELVSIEGRAVTACDEYNKLTNNYNASIKSFPANLVVGMLHFNPREKRIFGEWGEKAAANEV
jgi:LemA protein